jgi:hypothetical protein
MLKGRHFKLSLQDRLSIWANKVREQAADLPPAAQKNALLKKADQIEPASDLDEQASARAACSRSIAPSRPLARERRNRTSRISRCGRYAHSPALS